MEREEGQGVSGQARRVKWRPDSWGSPAGSPLGHHWPRAVRPKSQKPNGPLPFGPSFVNKWTLSEVVGPRVGSVCVASPLTKKEIRSNPPNLLSISLLPAPRPARPAGREAWKMRATGSGFCRCLGNTSECVCLCMSECVDVHECVCARPGPPNGRVDFAAWAAL